MFAAELVTDLVRAVVAISIFGGVLGAMVYLWFLDALLDAYAAFCEWRLQRQYRLGTTIGCRGRLEHGRISLPILAALVLASLGALQACSGPSYLWGPQEVTAHQLWVERVKAGW